MLLSDSAINNALQEIRSAETEEENDVGEFKSYMGK